jgi:hypothetical protein
MTLTVEKTPVTPLGALLQKHQEVVSLSRELIRLSLCARAANRIGEALAAERAAEDCIANAAQLEERLKSQL